MTAVQLRTGKLPAVYDPGAILYREYLKVTPVPSKVNPPPITAWGMLGNDQVGDCVIASRAHLTMLDTSVGAGATIGAAAVDGAKVASARDLHKEILRKKIGQNIQLTVWRRGESVTIAVATAELPQELTRVSNTPPTSPARADAELLGLKLKDVTAGALIATVRDYAPDEATPVFHHVGVYAYRPAALAAYPS